MPPQILETIRQSKEAISREPKILVAAAAAGLLCAGWLLYIPPLGAIRRTKEEWRQLKEEVTASRQILAPVRKGEALPPVDLDQLPTVLEELHALARSHQVEFTAVSPGAARPGTPGLMVIPVELQAEAGYRSLGEFLGELKRTSSLGGAFVRRLTIDREERLLPRLRARISMELVLSHVSDGT